MEKARTNARPVPTGAACQMEAAHAEKAMSNAASSAVRPLIVLLVVVQLERVAVMRQLRQRVRTFRPPAVIAGPDNAASIARPGNA